MVSHMVKPCSVLVVFSCSLFFIGFAEAQHVNSMRIHEICQSYTGRRIYLESSEHGFIQATNFSDIHQRYKTTKIDRITRNSSANIHYQCQLELVTCSACVFQITITDSNITQTCAPNDFHCDCPNYISFSEAPYDTKSPERKWCGKLPYTFRSKSRVLVITYVYELSQYNAFNITYWTEKNLLTYDGYVSNNETISVKPSFQSPFFPNFYPRDLIIEHLIRCNSTDDIECVIEIVFTDFQISLSSMIEFYDDHNQLLAKYDGDIFRPPILRSASSTILVKFHASGGTGYGYRANINYLSQMQANQSTNTHCGGLVSSFGGVITMMNMTATATKTFDCVWLIKPPNSYLHVKTHLLARIDTFENMVGPSVMMVRDGVTSAAPLLELYEWPTMKAMTHTSQTYVTSLSTGFYVAFRGVFAPNTRLAIVYTAFSYMDCLPGPEFLCTNQRCIPFYLQCDGFDHCGDGTDEHENCTPHQDDYDEVNQYWNTHSPNYFFPKNERYPDLKTAAVVFLASAMSLVMLILLLIIILYRMNHHVREQRELQSQIRTISELLDNTSINQSDENDANNELPPAYEHPPDYEEASSIKCEVSSWYTEREQPSRKQSRSHSRSRSRSLPYDENRMADVSTSCTPTPSTLLIPELFFQDEHGLAITDVIECAVSSKHQGRRLSSPASVEQSRRSSQVLLIPDSPPPEYTPRRIKIHTMLQSARKMEIEQSLIINPMETVHIINDETTHVAAMPFVDGVSELFLIVPTNTPTDATDRMVPHSNLNIEESYNDLIDAVFVEELEPPPEIHLDSTIAISPTDEFEDIPLPNTTQDPDHSQTPPPSSSSQASTSFSGYNRNLNVKIERHRFKSTKQRSLSENEIFFLFICHKTDSRDEIPHIRRVLSDSLLST